jgi:hypothetical protein
VRRLWRERMTGPVKALLRRLGGWMAGAPAVPFPVAEVVGSASADPLGTLGRCGMTGLHAILGWTAVVPVVVLAVYRTLRPTLRAARGRLVLPDSGPAATPREARPPLEAR